VGFTQSLLPHCSARELSTLLPTLIKLGYPPSRAWRDAYLAAVDAQLGAGTGKEEGGEEKGGGGGAGQLDSSSSSNSISSVATPTPLLAAAAVQIKPQDAAMLIWALGQTDDTWHLHPGLLRSLVTALTTAAPRLSPQALAAAARGWAGTWGKLRRGAGHSQQGGGSSSRGGTGRDATGGPEEEEQVDEEAHPSRCMQRRQQLMRLHGWSSMWQSWLHAAVAALPHASAVEVCRMGNALALLREVLPAEILAGWWEAVWGGALAPAVVEECTTTELSGLLWALAAQARVPPSAWLGRVLSRACLLAAEGHLHPRTQQFDEICTSGRMLTARGYLNARNAKLLALALQDSSGVGVGADPVVQ